MIHLREITLARDGDLPDRFPFNVPVIQALDRLAFTSDITFLVGENGSGKSTVLETIACAAQLPTVGSESVDTDPTLAAMRQLSQHLRWTWNKRTRRGFFMRAEDFFGYAKSIARTRQELADDLDDIEARYGQGKNKTALDLMKQPLRGELHALDQRYGAGLDAQSHGESYLKLFRSRFVPDGLYLLDEPEAPLSPLHQLSFLTMLKLMVEQGAQFIIASHSPVILAYPGAAILSFDGGEIRPADYDSLEHVIIMRTFLNDPQSYLRHLLA